MNRNAFRNIAARLATLVIRNASAHCDTEDGPAVTDAIRALEEGNVNIALKWVHPQGEDEVRAAYDRAHQALGTPEADAARSDYLNTLVRVHRAGEGAGFDGIQAAGTGVTPQVAAADKALEIGSIEPLRGLIDAERWAELETRFQKALNLKDFDVNDLGAARTYTEAYVSFFKYAEGHDHAHHHGSDHADAHAEHAHDHHAHAGH